MFVPFLFLWVWIARFKLTRKLPIVSTVLSFALIALFILPITFYNYSRFHRFVLLNTNSGYALFWGNNPIYGTKFIPILSTPEYQAMIPEEVRHLDEAALDSELLGRGIQFVVQDPKRYILLSLSRIPPYFMFWYSPESSTLSNISRIGSFGVFLPFMLYGLFLGLKKTSSFMSSRLPAGALDPVRVGLFRSPYPHMDIDPLSPAGEEIIATGKNLFADYTFDKDALFAQINLKGDELDMYYKVHEALAEKIERPDLLVYLQATTDTLMQRIALRDRPYERQMERSYINRA